MPFINSQSQPLLLNANVVSAAAASAQSWNPQIAIPAPPE
jgi:hypothetical protein